MVCNIENVFPRILHSEPDLVKSINNSKKIERKNSHHNSGKKKKMQKICEFHVFSARKKIAI